MTTSSIPNSLVSLLGDKKIWINWTLEQAKNTDGSDKFGESGEPKMTKIPRRLSGSFASVSDPDSWSTYQEAEDAYNDTGMKPRFSGVGVVFEDSLKLVGVDLDKYIKDGKLTDDKVFEFLIQADTYTELSPSGTGLHVFFQTEEPFDPILKKHHDEENDVLVTEIYSRGRYFTFTKNVYGEDKPVRKVSTDEINSLLSILGYPWGKTNTAPTHAVAGGTSTLDDSSILQKMWVAKNGPQIKALYDGDLSKNGGDHSSADMALASHLAFWTGRDAAAMERIWMNSKLGAREKTQKRKDYRDRTIENAIRACKEVYTPKSVGAPEGAPEGSLDFDDYGFTLGKGDVPQLTLDNICKVLEKDIRFMDKFRLNSFSNMIECKDLKGNWINLLDFYVLDAQRDISVAHPYFSRLSEDMMKASIKLIAADNSINPPVDWLRSLTWDGAPRLASWLYKTYGCPDDDLHQAMGSNFLKQMVQRMTTPGCQADLVLCLEGGQGTRKSSSLRILGGDWFAENVTSVDSKDDMIVFAGNTLVEFSEGAVLSRASISKLKSVITSTVDKFRPPYERGLASFPRGCVFSLSTNDSSYLKDETGGRRFLIVKLGKMADTKWLAENRDQLFAEALHRVEVLGENAYEFSDESAEELKELQESRTEDNAYDDVVIDWYLGRSGETQEKGFTILDVYTNAVHTGTDSKEMSKQMEWGIRSILKRALYLENRVMPRDENGKRSRRYVPSEKTRKKFKLGRKSSVDGVDEFARYGSGEKEEGGE